jgi:hypothetical protein
MGKIKPMGDAKKDTMPCEQTLQSLRGPDKIVHAHRYPSKKHFPSEGRPICGGLKIGTPLG